MIECENHNKCIEKAILDANSICNFNNLRFTDLRQRVFEIILKTHKPIKAYDVLSELQKDDLAAKPSTIYRTLDFLLECGLIHKIFSSNSYTSCSHPARHNQCYFLICNKCKEIKECCDENLGKALSNITKTNNFKVSNAIIEVNGLCDKCSKAK